MVILLGVRRRKEWPSSEDAELTLTDIMFTTKNLEPTAAYRVHPHARSCERMHLLITSVDVHCFQKDRRIF